MTTNGTKPAQLRQAAEDAFAEEIDALKAAEAGSRAVLMLEAAEKLGASGDAEAIADGINAAALIWEAIERRRAPRA